MKENKIALSAAEVQLVKDILAHHLPLSTKIWLFGSRATGRAKKYSDIDLLVDANGSSLSLERRAKLANAFEESVLPYKVDIADAASIDAEFAKKIDEEKILFLIIGGH